MRRGLGSMSFQIISFNSPAIVEKREEIAAGVDEVMMVVRGGGKGHVNG